MSEKHTNADVLSRFHLPEAPRQTNVPAELVLILAELLDAPVYRGGSGSSEVVRPGSGWGHVTWWVWLGVALTS